MSRACSALLLFFAAACSCGGNEQLCTANCPNVAGTWAIVLDATNGSVSDSCTRAGINPPASPLVLSQAGAVLGGSIDEFQLSGSLYDTFDMSLNGLNGDAGSSTPDSVALHCRYIPGLTDGGAKLQGDLNATYQRTYQGQPVTCAEYFPLTATRQ